MSKHFIKQAMMFGVVGVITLLIDLSVTTLFFNVLHFPAFLSSGIGFLSGFFFNFPVNRKRVFKHSKEDRFSLKGQVVLYVALSVFNLTMTSLLVEMLVSINLVTIGYAKLVATAIIAVWNFLLYRYFIFSGKNSDDIPTPIE
jgi:putative flippase GtrA